MNEQSKVFLNKISEKIKEGVFDDAVSVFVSKELIYSSIKARVLKKLENGATPLLTDAEIKDAIKDAKETGLITSAIFIKIGLLEKTENGYQVCPKYKKLLRYL